MSPLAHRRVLIGIVIAASVLATVAAPSGPAAAAAGCFTVDLTNGERMRVSAIDEASGLVLSRQMPGVMWTHNDNNETSGTANNRIYAVNEMGELLATVQIDLSSRIDIVPDSTFVELEDISFGPGPDGDPNWLYLADTGDNNPTRPYASVYRLAEPVFTPDPQNPVTINLSESALETTRFQYQSFLNPNDTRSRNVEAMFVDPATGSLFLIEKALHYIDETGNFVDNPDLPQNYSFVHRIGAKKLFPDDPSAMQLAPIVSHIRAQFNETTFGVSAADISADGTIIAVKNLEETFYWVRDPNETILATLAADHEAPCLVPTGMRGEALAIGPTSDRIVTVREGTLSPIWQGVFTNQDYSCFGKPATILGTAGDDVIGGTAGDDVIVTFGGNDRVWGKTGYDRICLGPGDDYADGGRHRDRIDGGWGDDVIAGGNGYDILWGRAGADTIGGNAHNDRVYGGDGADTLAGGTESDVIYGMDGPDRIVGRSHNDTLIGGKGADTVNGGSGDDSLAGGFGTDECNGGKGTDTASSCEAITGVP